MAGPLPCGDNGAEGFTVEIRAVKEKSGAPHLCLSASERLMRAGAHLVAGIGVECPCLAAVLREINTAHIAVYVAAGGPPHLLIQEFDLPDRPWRVQNPAAPCSAAIGRAVQPARHVR